MGSMDLLNGESTERRRMVRLLEVIERNQRSSRLPARQLFVESDGIASGMVETVKTRSHLILPATARSVTLRDERGIVRAFAFCHELYEQRRSFDRSRIAMSLLAEKRDETRGPSARQDAFQYGEDDTGWRVLGEIDDDERRATATLVIELR